MPCLVLLGLSLGVGIGVGPRVKYRAVAGEPWEIPNS